MGQGTTKRRFTAGTASVAAACAAALLAGCGGGTKTVTASGSVAPRPTTPTTPTTTTTSKRTANSPQTTSTTTPSEAAKTSSQTRTAPEPAFAQNGGTSSSEAEGAEVAAAVAAVKSRGYTPNDTSEYHANQTLRVLTATRTGSADGYAQQAFFFVDGKYIGTDASAPSASVRVVEQSDTEVVLAYSLYRAHDSLCCPGGGQAKVHFQLNDGRLVALQQIPPVSSASGLSRQ